jgi:hypothetical protein
MIHVVGLEGSISGPVNWGTPAVEDDNGIFNPVSGQRVSAKKFKELVAEGHVSQFQLHTRHGSIPGDAIQVDFVPEVHCIIRCGVLTKILNSGEGTLSGDWQHFSFRNMREFDSFADRITLDFQKALLEIEPWQTYKVKEALEVLMMGRI